VLQTGFDFQQRRCIPIINGIVIAQENYEVVMEVCFCAHLSVDLVEEREEGCGITLLAAFVYLTHCSLQAWHEHTNHVETLSNAKRKKEVLAKWRKLIIGLRVRARLLEKYGNASKVEETESTDEDEQHELYHGSDTEEETNATWNVNEAMEVDNNV
jgi:xeroderma pigmentosum group C-complementing protein